MTSITDIEQAAMRQCLKAFGRAAEAIGFHTPLGQYTETQALQVIEAIITGWTQAMTEHHENLKYPPVRGMPVTADPLCDNPFAGLKDDLPWEDGK